MKRRSLLVAAGLACSLLAGKAVAALNLVETIWVAQSPGCTIREIRFYDFGHALVKAEQIGSDEADWVAIRSTIHIRFEHWNGALDGEIGADGEFEATYTWHSEETLAADSMPCAFRRR